MQQTFRLWPEQVATDAVELRSEAFPSHVAPIAVAFISVGAQPVWQPLGFIYTGNADLEARVQALERKVAELEKRLAAQEEEEVVVLRDISREQAKEEIRQMFLGGKDLYYSDIAKALRLDLPTVVELCQELIDEGEVEVATNAL